MTPEEALNILDQTSRIASMDRISHLKAVEAIKTLEAFINKQKAKKDKGIGE